MNGSFRFQVLDAAGKRREITQDAPDAAAARRILHRKKMIVLRELTGSVSFAERMRNWSPGKKFDLLAFTNHLAPLLAANVPLERSLAVLEEGASDPRTLEVIFDLRRRLHEGKRFSQLLQERSDVFPPIYTGLIEAGEEAGCLPEVSGELRRFLTESREFRDFVVTSSIYPLIVAGVTLGVVILLFTVFVPRFAKVFEDMGKELPALTQIMLDISNFLTTNWWLFLLLIGGLVYLIRRSCQPGKLRQIRDRYLLKLPLIGPLIVSVQISNFMKAMAIMCANHVHLLQSLKISLRMITNTAIQSSFERVSDDLRDGGKLSDALGGNPYLPRGTSAMLKVAEESGEVGEMFERIAAEEQAETRLKFKRLLAMLEPAIILVLAVMVLTVVLAVFMAIWKMNSIR